MARYLLYHTAVKFKDAAKEKKAPIWNKLADFAKKPSRAERVVNLSKLERVTKENDTVVVPGKVLGTGSISHKISLYSFSISQSATRKIINSGGKVITQEELLQNNSKGKDVKIIG